ncbi:MAG: hypothetical protein ACR2QO_03615 [Acidimicrobiales bacterium]
MDQTSPESDEPRPDRQGGPLIAAPQARLVADDAEDNGAPDHASDQASEPVEDPTIDAPGDREPAFRADDTSPIDADVLLDSLLGEEAIDPHSVNDGAPPTPPPAFELEQAKEQVQEPSPTDGEIYEPTEVELHRMPPPVVKSPEPEAVAAEDRSASDGLAARATAPELGALELRQIAGLTSGSTMPLEPQCYDFAQDDGVVGFQIQVDRNDRAVVIPRATTTRIDTIEIDGPSVIGLGVLDVGSARFLARHRREHKRATDWLDLHDAVDRPEPVVEVPPNLGEQADGPGKATKRRRGRRAKREAARNAAKRQTLDATSWDFIERIRSTRIELTDRERYLHPDPAELAERARQRAPILAIRPPGHPLFAKVSVIAADMPWMPRFDDISAIPDHLGEHLKPLMSLPSQPIAADLMVGPLGIVGNPSARTACARHVITSLYGLSTPELRLHIATTHERESVWDWCYEVAPPGPIDVVSTFPVVIVDGMASFAGSGLAHADAIEHKAGAVFLADSVEDLPSYCGTVLQVDGAGSGLLTNNLGNIIAGTPIGITTALATEVADDLVAVMERRHRT